LGPRRERLLRCAGPGLPAAACWRDETYEGIEAPHWADLTDPNAGRADVDDKAWFCRPGTLSLPFRSLAGSPLAGGRAGGAPVACWLGSVMI